MGEASLGIIDACYVEPEARGVGVGRALIDSLVAWFTASGCRGVDVTALPGDRETKNFLEGLGVQGPSCSPCTDPCDERRCHRRHRCRWWRSAVSPWSEERCSWCNGPMPPGAGRWTVPGGRVEPGESVTAAVERELLEETALAVRCGSLVGWAERRGPEYHFVILDFEVTAAGPTTPAAGGDAAAVAWVPLGEVTSLTLVEGLEDFLVDHGVLV